MAGIFTAKDIHFIYSESTGAIPFIFNKDQTKVKQLLDEKIIEISEKHRCSNHLTSAKNAFSDSYNQDMSYVNMTAIFAHVTPLQNLQHFGLQNLGSQTPLGMDQIKFLSKNYSKKFARTHKKEVAKDQKKKQIEEEKAKIFDF